MNLQPLLRAIFGVTNRDLEQAIQIELSEGAAFERLTIPMAGLKKFHVIQFFKVTGSGRAIAGLGVDLKEQYAYRKAIFEYFERKAVISVGLQNGFTSTNGVAAHRYPALAFRAAMNELFERDAFLRHWYSRTPFIAVDDLSSLSPQIRLDELHAFGYRPFFCKTHLGFFPTTLAFLIHQKTGNFALGLSSGRGGGDLNKSFLEAAINLFFGNEGKTTEELLQHLKDHGVVSLRDHRTFWLQANPIPGWLHDPISIDSNLGRPRKPTPKIERVTLANSPVDVVGARCDEALDLALGLPKERDLLILRRSNLLPSDGLLFPHPIP